MAVLQTKNVGFTENQILEANLFITWSLRGLSSLTTRRLANLPRMAEPIDSNWRLISEKETTKISHKLRS